MLKELEILNGILSPSYDIYNNVYTVKVENNIESLVLNYKLDENVQINIQGNDNLKEGENIIYLILKKDDLEEVITLYVNKEISKKVIFTDPNIITKAEVKPVIASYVAPLIGGCCFLIILLTFIFLFKKKKNKK